MKRTTKWLLGFAVLAIAVLVFAAGPPPGTYTVPGFFTTNNAKIYGANGITVSSNISVATVPSVGAYVIDGSAFVGKTNIFNPNQFSQIGVGGTNVNIKDGTKITNLFTFKTNVLYDATSPALIWTNAATASYAFYINGANSFTLYDIINNFEQIRFSPNGVDIDPNNSSGGVAASLNFLGFQCLSAQQPGAATTRTLFINADGEARNIYVSGLSGATWHWTETNAENLVLFTNVAGVAFSGSVTNHELTASKLTRTDANKKWVSSTYDDTIFTNNFTFNANQFSLTGTGGTNANIKSGALVTNFNLFGLNTNNGSMDVAGASTNWGTTRFKADFANESTTTNTGAINNAAGVTNWSNERVVGAAEFQSTATNSGAINNAAAVTNWSTTRLKGAVAIESQTTIAAETDVGGLVATNGMTNLIATANTVAAHDANKKIVSIANPSIGAGQPLIFNGTNSFFQEVDDGWLINDEFNATTLTTGGGGTMWTTLSSGTAGSSIKTSSTNWGEMTMTNGPTAADRIGAVNPNTTATYVVTNTELWIYVRVNVGTANSSTISNHFAFGFGDTFSGQTSNGFWVQQAPKSTVWQACFANAGALTTNALTVAVTKDEWREFIMHLDTSQTAIYYYSGNRAANSTIWCTNSGISLPTAACNFFFSARRMATQTSGSATNLIDHFKVWKRNLL